MNATLFAAVGGFDLRAGIVAASGDSTGRRGERISVLPGIDAPPGRGVQQGQVGRRGGQA